MDQDAIICSMIDRLARGPDQDVHVPSVVGPKYPSRRVDVIYSYLTIGGVVWGPTRPLRRLLGALGYLTFLTGTGRHRAQITYFFRGQVGSWRSLGVGLVVDSRLHRIRHRCGSLVLSEGPESKRWPKLAIPLRAAERNRPKMLEAAAYAV